MAEKVAHAAKETEKGVQRCINRACGATFGLRERIYVCPRCGETLEIDCRLVRPHDPAALRRYWAAKTTSSCRATRAACGAIAKCCRSAKPRRS